ncbi:hypothetical protein ACT3SZ_04980 [Corynebacterium sp. AOP40-9SA-29]|uniref:hypothetical protein n=1 Tax=Corynebacterium sp. AOP40-9SA-29 TaxID=3457677 RepID=UPI0040343D5E
MKTITGAGWHYGTVHASDPTPSPAPFRRRLGRPIVAVAATLAIGATGGALTACSSEPPRPDQGLESLVAQLGALEGTDAAGGTAIFTEQVDALNEEIVRLCGTDRDGVAPEGCEPTGGTTEAAESEDAADVADAADVNAIREAMLALIEREDADSDTAPDDDAERGRAVLLTGLFAALATLDDSTAGGSAIDQELLDLGFGGSGEVSEQTAQALAPATELVNQAVYLSGVVLPVAGTNNSTVTTVASRMRTVRDELTDASGLAAEVGYSTPEDFTQPTDSSSAAATLLDAVHAVTVALRDAVDEVADSDRALVATLCAMSARSEAALEDALGEDPLDVSVRGE